VENSAYVYTRTALFLGIGWVLLSTINNYSEAFDNGIITTPTYEHATYYGDFKHSIVNGVAWPFGHQNKRYILYN